MIKGRRKRPEPSREPQAYYFCDPALNVECAKTMCYINGGPCQLTARLECARQPVEKAFMVFPMSCKEAEELGFKCKKYPSGESNRT